MKRYILLLAPLACAFPAVPVEAAPRIARCSQRDRACWVGEDFSVCVY